MASVGLLVGPLIEQRCLVRQRVDAWFEYGSDPWHVIGAAQGLISVTGTKGQGCGRCPCVYGLRAREQGDGGDTGFSAAMAVARCGEQQPHGSVREETEGGAALRRRCPGADSCCGVPCVDCLFGHASGPLIGTAGRGPQER